MAVVRSIALKNHLYMNGIIYQEQVAILSSKFPETAFSPSNMLLTKQVPKRAEHCEGG